MKSTDELRSEFDSLEKSDIESMINLYESNKHTIETINSNKDLFQLETKMLLTCEYALSLVSSKYYKKAITIFPDGIVLFEQLFKKEELTEKNYYQHILKNYAFALSKVDELPNASKIYRTLYNLDKENKEYSKWYKSIKLKIAQKKTNYIWGIFLVWLISDFTIFPKLQQPYFLISSILGAISLIVVVIHESHKYSLKKVANKA